MWGGEEVGATSVGPLGEWAASEGRAGLATAPVSPSHSGDASFQIEDTGGQDVCGLNGAT